MNDSAHLVGENAGRVHPPSDLPPCWHPKLVEAEAADGMPGSAAYWTLDSVSVGVQGMLSGLEAV